METQRFTMLLSLPCIHLKLPIGKKKTKTLQEKHCKCTGNNQDCVFIQTEVLLPSMYIVLRKFQTPPTFSAFGVRSMLLINSFNTIWNIDTALGNFANLSRKKSIWNHSKSELHFRGLLELAIISNSSILFF